ncbi:unnamed protein product [Cylindrotheca closterium]|uniref:Cytochrome b5 heme-binding domain-containing protein n=1 Tax=Cylindrotheca closterium TaxID=2856 RepID=A0AAD2G6W4_9STRA|nr:unnamed protein product [Cylindrotheca closterium]
MTSRNILFSISLVIGILYFTIIGRSGASERRLVTLEELETKNGENGSLIWLSILGKVYDVTEGKEYYGPGQSYNSLTAADTTVPFVSGTFTKEEAKKDPVELSDSDLTGILEWQKFYSESDKYHLVGKLVDPRYYDEHGKEQPTFVTLLERLEKIKISEEEKKAVKEANKKARLEQAAKQEEANKKAKAEEAKQEM